MPLNENRVLKQAEVGLADKGGDTEGLNIYVENRGQTNRVRLTARKRYRGSLYSCRVRKFRLRYTCIVLDERSRERVEMKQERER